MSETIVLTAFGSLWSAMHLLLLGAACGAVVRTCGFPTRPSEMTGRQKPFHQILLLGRRGWAAAERAELRPQVLDEAARRRQVGRLLGEDRVERVGAARRDLSGRKQEPEQALR